MPLDAVTVYSFGSQAMGKSYSVHIVLEKDDEDLLVVLAVLDDHDFLYLGWFDVVLEIDLELFQPVYEILNLMFDPAFPYDIFDHTIVSAHFQYVLEKYPQQV